MKDPTQPLTDEGGEAQVPPEQKEKKEKKKTVLEAGGDKDPPTTITTGATSAAALTIMNNLPDTQQNIKGEMRKILGFRETFLVSQTEVF